MRTKTYHNGRCTVTQAWLSARDTENWAYNWPCSTVGGRRLFVEFDGTDLVDLVVDGGRGDQDCDGHELTAITDDLVFGKAGR